MSIPATLAALALTGSALGASEEPIRSVLYAAEASGACHRIPSLVVGTDGTILAFSDYRTEGHGDHGQRTDLVLRRSQDGGQTWEAVQVLAADPEINHHSGPAVVDRETGRIFKFFRRNARAAKNNYQLHGHWTRDRDGFLDAGFGSFLIHSDDQGRTWSAPRAIRFDIPGADGFQGIGNGVHGVQLADGRLVVHAWAFRSRLRKGDRTTDALALFLVSADHGETWTPGASWPRDHGSQEIAYAVSGDVLLCNARTVGPRRIVGTTTDPARGTVAFAPAEDLPEPMCHASLAAEGGDSLRMAFCNPAIENLTGIYQRETRHHLTLRLSEDGGLTWPVARVVTEGWSGYSDLVWHDGRILCLYETGAERYDQELHFISVTPEWVRTAP